MSWTIPFPPRRFAVGEHPDVGGNAGVVKELFRQRDQRFEPVVLQNPAADLALAAAGIARKQRRAVHDNRDSRTAFIDRLHVREHVLEK